MRLDDDPRWRRLNDTSTPCGCCGGSFGGVFDLHVDHPDPWPHGSRRESGLDRMRSGEDWLTSDLCVCGDGFYLRCVLPLPIRGADDTVFRYGVWASLAEPSFRRHAETFQTDAPFGRGFGWLMNSLAAWGNPEPLPCEVVGEEPGRRPWLLVHEDAHPIALSQRDGITFDHLLDLYAANGVDVRHHLGHG